MIKLTDKMRIKLLETGRYKSARLVYIYNKDVKMIYKFDRNETTLLDAKNLDLGRWFINDLIKKESAYQTAMKIRKSMACLDVSEEDGIDDDWMDTNGLNETFDDYDMSCGGFE